MAADGLAGFVRDAGRVGLLWASPPTPDTASDHVRAEIVHNWPELRDALDALVLPEKTSELDEREL